MKEHAKLRALELADDLVVAVCIRPQTRFRRGGDFAVEFGPEGDL